MIKILHNTSCSKSCAALQLLERSGEKLEIHEYLHRVPSQSELKDILRMLGITAEELVRKKEPYFQENLAGVSHTEQEWIDIMIEHPILIERPIVIVQGRAVIGRPIEKVLALLNEH